MCECDHTILNCPIRLLNHVVYTYRLAPVDASTPVLLLSPVPFHPLFKDVVSCRGVVCCVESVHD